MRIPDALSLHTFIHPTTAICLLLIVSTHASAQRTDFPDTIRISSDTSAIAPQDTLQADTLRQRSRSGIDSVVVYSATDSVIYTLSNRTMYLYGKGDIKYRELGLKAENIDINWITSILNAQGVPDTADTAGKGIRGKPDLIDGNETYTGSKITYNFRTKKGKINIGETEIDQGLYYGEAIKKVDTDVLFVAGGRYTTCDLDEPHYYFASPEMKVVVRDKVVARPVYLYLSDVPVFALPFGIFPNQRGRRSGIIPPAYGEDYRGRFLQHLGYYWAMSDYTDWAIRADGYTRGSWRLSSDFRYALRYNFSGSIGASLAKTIVGERGDPGYRNQSDFNIGFNHNQEFDPTTRLVVNFTFTSGSYFRNTSFSFNDILTQNIVSNATLTKSWEGTPNSMTINLRRDQNLQTDEVREVLPNITFSRSQSFPFRSPKRAAGGDLSFLELIGYTYNAGFVNNRSKLLVDSAFVRDERRGVNHSLAINASPKVGYFTVTPFFNYAEKWYDKSIRREFNPVDSTVVTSDVKAIKAVRYFDMGVSTGTKFYGIFEPDVFGIKGIRHQVTPSISYTYQPDFSKPHFGYYGTHVDAKGNSVKYSFYEREPFGGAPAEERQAISFRMGNVFEMKTASTDTSGEDNKFQLLNLDLATSYNFARDSLKFDQVTLSYRTSIGQLLSISGGSTYNLYKFEPDPADPRIGRRVNKYLLSEGKLAQLTGFNISVSTRLSGEKKETKSGPAVDTLAQQHERSGYVGLYDEQPPDFSIPWNLDLTWNFGQSQPDPRFKTRSSNIAVGLGFNLTDNWKISASTNYDLINKLVAAPQITVYRDLHCWEMNFTWVPTGINKHYRFEIRLKAPQLQDIKVTKQSFDRR